MSGGRESHSFESSGFFSRSCSFRHVAQGLPCGGGRSFVVAGMKDEDLAYYRQRAERETELAREARHPNAERAHAMLAGYYADMVEKDVVRPFRQAHRRLN